MKLTKATLKKIIKEEISSTRERPVRRGRRRTLREGSEMGRMEKKLFDKMDEAHRAVSEMNEIFQDEVADNDSYFNPNGQTTLSNKVLKRLGILIEDAYIALGMQGGVEYHYPGNNHDDDDDVYYGRVP